MTRRARLVAVAAVVAVAVSGCGVPGQSRPTKLEDDRVRVAPPSTTTSVPPGVPTESLQLCLVAGDRLVRTETGVAAPTSVADVLDALTSATRSALPDGTRSAITGTDLIAARPTRHGVAHVDLHTAFLEILPADQILAIAQIVCTLTGLPGIGQVRFTQEGRPTDVPRADSSLTDEPVSRDDYASLLPPGG